MAYGMNGPQIPTRHGAPVRLRVARQLGYKSIKHLGRMAETDTLANVGEGPGSLGAEEGDSWFARI
jgi:DMSO/TMAO reductase YedYZ molybdopterin-dependent catalytic subunit